jgi:hypothetical protein
MATKQQELRSFDLPEETESDMNIQTFYYSPWCFLRAMFLIAWSAFAHPLSSTVIDLKTGRVLPNGQDETE